MNLIGAIGARTVYTWDEVCGFLGMSRLQVKGFVRKHELVKRYDGAFGFDQGDVNDFLHRLNHGKIKFGRGPKRGSPQRRRERKEQNS